MSRVFKEQKSIIHSPGRIAVRGGQRQVKFLQICLLFKNKTNDGAADDGKNEGQSPAVSDGQSGKGKDSSKEKVSNNQCRPDDAKDDVFSNFCGELGGGFQSVHMTKAKNNNESGGGFGAENEILLKGWEH